MKKVKRFYLSHEGTGGWWQQQTEWRREWCDVDRGPPFCVRERKRKMQTWTSCVKRVYLGFSWLSLTWTILWVHVLLYRRLSMSGENNVHQAASCSLTWAPRFEWRQPSHTSSETETLFFSSSARWASLVVWTKHPLYPRYFLGNLYLHPLLTVLDSCLFFLSHTFCFCASF